MIQIKKVELSNKSKVLNDILIEYSNENSIDAIFKKESILISQNKSDITNIILDRLNNKLNKID